MSTFTDAPFSPSKVQVFSLDWLDIDDEDSATFRHLSAIRPHLILAADIVYDPDLFQVLCRVLRCSLQAGVDDAGMQPYALIASTVRNQATYSNFLDVVCECGG